MPSNQSLTKNQPYSTIFSDPILAAAASGNIPQMQLLISQGYSVNSGLFSRSMENPLCMAIENGHLEAATFLIEHGANVNFLGFLENTTPLSIASALGDQNFVQYLLNAGATLS